MIKRVTATQSDSESVSSRSTEPKVSAVVMGLSRDDDPPSLS